MGQREASFVLDSGYRCFAVFGAQRVADETGPLGSTLVEWLEPSPDEPVLIVNAGAQFGPYDVLVRIGEEAPVDPVDRSWEDVTEVGFTCSEALALGDLEAGWGEELPASPGAYRMRVSAVGRTESSVREAAFPDDEEPEETIAPLERYLLELWPAPFQPASVIRETSQLAQDLRSPPEPEWPAERAPGLEAARRVAADLRGTEGSRTLGGRLDGVLVTMEVDGTPLRIYNRVKRANGWPPSNGGMLSRNDEVGNRCTHYGDPPDSDGLAPLLGTLETTVLEIDKPRRFVMSWNWRVAGPDGAPYPTNPLLLAVDSTVSMTFAEVSPKGEDPRTSVTVHHTGVPHEWLEDLRLLWAWDIAVSAHR